MLRCRYPGLACPALTGLPLTHHRQVAKEREEAERLATERRNELTQEAERREEAEARANRLETEVQEQAMRQLTSTQVCKCMSVRVCVCACVRVC